MTANHFLFMDSTGAEYYLDQNTGNVWSSTESTYVYFDANTSTLHFRDGTSWYFGCVSSEIADLGTMYPTLMQDTNGNNITVVYEQASGATWTNSSARISTITDVRATSGASTYQLSYTGSSPPHLSGISNSIGSGETYTLSFLTGQTLISPFASPPPSTTTAFLSSLAVIAGTYTFVHNGSGELTKITLPYGGYLAYDYGTTTYSSGLSYREVTNRYLSKDGSTQTTYPITHEPTPGPDVHSYTILDDPGGVGEKYWAFSTSGTYEGLVTQYQGRQLPGPVAKIQNDFTWAQDAVSNSYISSTLITADPGQTYQAQKKTNQTVDIYGNVTQVQNFDWGSLTTPAKTYNYTYLAGTGSHTYITDYILNRLATASVTDGTNTVSLAQNSYDGGYWYLGVYYGPNYGLGRLSNSATPTGSTYIVYNSDGSIYNTQLNGITTIASYSGSPNNAAPSQITVGSLSQSISYTSFLRSAIDHRGQWGCEFRHVSEYLPTLLYNQCLRPDHQLFVHDQYRVFSS